MGKSKHPIFLWVSVICGTAVTVSLLTSVFYPVPKSSLGNPEDFTLIYETPLVEPWGADPVSFYVSETLALMSPEQKIRSLIIANQPGRDPSALNSFVSSNELGGVIIMGSNVPETPEDLSGITSSLLGDPQLPRLIGIDEEGGYVSRLSYDGFAGANSLRYEPVISTTQAFSGRGQLLRSVGVNLNFGVVADVSADPASFIYSRSFGSSGSAVAERVSAAVDGENPFVLSTIKHFPGHGSAPGDSHIGIPSSPLSFEQWISSDAVPFQAGIDSGAEMVMFGHLAFPDVDPLPSSLSPLWHEVLRNQLGFEGVSITDDLTMLEASGLPQYENRVTNAVLALAAGNDVLLYVAGADFDAATIVVGVLTAIQTGEISQAQIDNSVRRVLTLRRELYPEARTWIPPCDERCFIWATQ
jgi:beta-N-acetylhexosaminidase